MTRLRLISTLSRHMSNKSFIILMGTRSIIQYFQRYIRWGKGDIQDSVLYSRGLGSLSNYRDYSIIATTAPLTSCLTSEKRLNLLVFSAFFFGVRQTARSDECCTKWINNCEELRMAVRLELERSSINVLQNVSELAMVQHLLGTSQ